ncbi:MULTISPECIES: helix-turn-helix domain containing protein [unclassified Clostridioides]|uniref:helix-turn-helix domain containing protein n=1 Tax=unclassified Clostridioides TaxID=2635829 RepID=UPI001D123997|nr:helix-turn-helix domain containing protein [Clostridioides sp. ES-S-0049-03]MCC0678214.1 helix-turn-helix domain containing protein [Clostridioides sp. ES-W-0018-02]MCC0713044.1 helix-turn-helix domain containing protein [Clostridioides sp. ES-W-0017-02]
MSIKYNDEKVFLVSENDKEKLEKYGINFISLDGNYYVVHQGRKNKRFTDEEVKEIKKDLDNGMSLRKCAEKWNCGKTVIGNIKQNTY